MKIRELITETPYLNREELPYEPLSRISANNIENSIKIGEVQDISVYLRKNSIVAGKELGGEFYVFVSISIRKSPWPVEPTQLDEPIQVAMVRVEETKAREGLTTKIYNIVASAFDLVSDHEQYLGAQRLWKSLARSTDVNVYVFDGNKKDYLRNGDGKIIKYNGSSIPDNKIWGSTITYRSILLVGTKKELH